MLLTSSSLTCMWTFSVKFPPSRACTGKVLAKLPVHHENATLLMVPRPRYLSCLMVPATSPDTSPLFLWTNSGWVLATASKHLLQQVVLTRSRLIPRQLQLTLRLPRPASRPLRLQHLLVIEHTTPALVDVCTAPARMLEHVAPHLWLITLHLFQQQPVFLTEPAISFFCCGTGCVASRWLFFFWCWVCAPWFGESANFFIRWGGLCLKSRWFFSCRGRVSPATLQASPSGTDFCGAVCGKSQERHPELIEVPNKNTPVPCCTVAPTPAREDRWKRHLAAQVPVVEHVTPAPDAVRAASAPVVQYFGPGIESGSSSSSAAHAAATRTDDIIEQLTNMCEHIEKRTEEVAMLAKRCAEGPLPPSLNQPDGLRTSSSETPQTNTIHPFAWDHGECGLHGPRRVATCTTRLTSSVRRCGRCSRWRHLGGCLASPDPFSGASRTRLMAHTMATPAGRAWRAHIFFRSRRYTGIISCTIRRTWFVHEFLFFIDFSNIFIESAGEDPSVRGNSWHQPREIENPKKMTMRNCRMMSCKVCLIGYRSSRKNWLMKVFQNIENLPVLLMNNLWICELKWYRET